MILASGDAAVGGLTKIEHHTQRFFQFRKAESAAGEVLAEAIADTGDQLDQLHAELGDEGFGLWLEMQRLRAKGEGVKAISSRTSDNYRAVARFRRRVGTRHPEFMSWSVSKLYCIANLDEAQLTGLLTHGVPMQDGTLKPVGEIGANELKRAVTRIRRASRPPKPAKPASYREALALLSRVDGLTDEEREHLIAVLRAPAPAQTTDDRPQTTAPSETPETRPQTPDDRPQTPEPEAVAETPEPRPQTPEPEAVKSPQLVAPMALPALTDVAGVVRLAGAIAAARGAAPA